MDQALKKAYNKPAKSQSGIIGISRRKETVVKWNIIKQDKSKFVTFLYELCSLDKDVEFSLHHECFSFLIDDIMNQKTHSSFSTTTTWEILLTKPKLTENLLNFCFKVPNWELKCIESTTRPALNRSLQNYLTTYQKQGKQSKSEMIPTTMI